MQNQENYQEAVNEFVKRAWGKYEEKIDRIILFGSVARGEAHEGSDIDILVIWKGNKLEGWDVLEDIAVDILLEYGQLISIKIIYLHEYFGMMETGSSFIQNINGEGVVIG